MPASRLPAPAVPPEAYDEDYYRRACAGFEEWTRSEGGEVGAMYAGSLAIAGLAPGEVVVDVGTGRGELLAVAVQQGAARAIGIEYSPAAVRLARHTLAVQGVGERAEVLEADSRAMPLPDGCADLVTMLDVVEHLAPAELDATLREVRRVLRPGGRVLVHTLPSRTLYSVTYRLQRLLVPGRRRRWPADPRNDFERRMHVNEQTVTSLRRALRRAGFPDATAHPGEWVHADFVPDERARRLYRRLASHRLTARLGAADVWGHARRPEAA